MNFRETATRALYLLLALASLCGGLWLIVDPVAANNLLQLQAGDVIQSALLRQIGAGYLCAGIALIACMRDAGLRRPLHVGSLLFFGLLAVFQIGEPATADMPPSVWLMSAPLALLVPVVLALMLVPLPSVASLPALPARSVKAPAGTETGVVKWFDSRKGFGFITRNNGEELFIHFRSISATDGGPRALRDGQSVRFRVGEGKKGPQAEDVVPIGKN